MSILEEFWYGNINPNEDRDISDEEKKLVELIARHQEFLHQNLRIRNLMRSRNMLNVLTSILPWLNARHLKLDLS